MFEILMIAEMNQKLRKTELDDMLQEEINKAMRSNEEEIRNTLSVSDSGKIDFDFRGV